MTVSTEETVPNPVSDCRYGDIVKLEGTSFHVYEIGIIGNEGNVIKFKALTSIAQMEL